MKKRTIAMLLALVMCVIILGGCAKDDVDPSKDPTPNPGPSQNDPNPAPTPDPGKPAEPFVYYWTRSSEETTQNPHQASTTNDTEVIMRSQGQLYSYYPTADGSTAALGPNLAAAEPTTTDGGFTWIIKINPNAKWSNGEKITAHTFEYSFKMQMDPLLAYQTGSLISTDAITIKNGNEYWSQGSAGTVKWEDVGVKAIDDETLQIVSSIRVTPFQVMKQFYLGYSSPVYEPIYSKCISADGTTCTYGTEVSLLEFSGPFTISTWNKTVEIVFEKNEQYLHSDLIHIDRVISRVVTDESTRLELFETGQSDSVTLGTNGMAKYEEDPRVMSYVSQSIETLEINQNHPEKPWLDDPIFRKAIFYAIDRNAIEGLTRNAARPYFLSSVAQCYADGTLYRSLPEAQALVPANGGYDPDLAKSYMKQAKQKYGVETFEIDILYTEGNDNRRLASEYIQSSLEHLFGDAIEITLSAATYSQINNTMRTSVQGPVSSWDLAWSSWAVTGEKTTPWMKLERYTTWHPRRYTMYKSTALDAKIDECKLEENRLDEKKLTALTVQAEQIMFDEMLCVPVYSTSYFVMYSERVDLPLKDHNIEIGWGWLYCKLK